jgi:hypothetical protein
MVRCRADISQPAARHLSIWLLLLTVSLGPGVASCGEGDLSSDEPGSAPEDMGGGADTTVAIDTDRADVAFDRGAEDTSSAVDQGAPDVARDTATADPDVVADSGGPEDGGPDAPTDTGFDVDPSCDPGDFCNPIVVTTFPFTDSRDTTEAPADDIDYYGCAPETDESGGEFYYRVHLPALGVLSASINEVSGDGVDVDVHLLETLDPDTCIDRDHAAVSALLEAGVYYIVIDTWVNSSGTEFPGPYTLRINWRPMNAGNCAMDDVDVRMFWSECDADLDCYESDGERYLRTPASGPVVLEAHLVTVDETFDGGWPSSIDDQIARHYQISEAATGYVMNRTQPWAPQESSEFGQGATGRPLPVVDESWYVNMYWRDRPEQGTRMILRNLDNGRAVVAAAGYETGPGSNTAIGGASEEIHHYLGTTHRSELMMGFARDADLPLGPIDCEF